MTERTPGGAFCVGLVLILLAGSLGCRRAGESAVSFRWLENTERTVAEYEIRPGGTAVFIGFAGYNVSAEMCQRWVYGVVGQSPYFGLFSKLYAVIGPKDPPYERRFIKNDVLARSDALTRASIIYIAAHSSGSYVADDFLNFVPSSLLSRIRFVILDGGQISTSHKNAVQNRFVSALKHLEKYRQTEEGKSLTLESWNYRLYKEFYGDDFIPLDADKSPCVTEHDIHDYVINVRSGMRGVSAYAGPRFNVAAAFPPDFAAELRQMMKEKR
jgi:hypothetical protein